MQAIQSGGVRSSVEAEPGYGQILAVLVRRKIWIVGAIAACLGLSVVYTLRQQPTYVSYIQLLVEPNYQGKTGKAATNNLQDEFADTNVELDSATQISLMQSSGLLKKAMSALQSQYSELNPDNPNSLNLFKQSLAVTQVLKEAGGKKVETKIFQVTYTSEDPEKTQTVLKAVQKVYLDYNLEQQRLRLVKGLSFINKQLPQIKSKVSSAETALEKFRTNQELVDPELQVKSRVDALNQIEQEQRVSAAQINSLRSTYTNLQQQVGLSPQQAVLASRLSQSPRYQSLLNELQKTDLELVKQRLRFKDNTPFVQQILEARQRQLGLLQVEVGRVVGSQDGAIGRSEQLLSSGQLGALDVTLVNQLVEAEVNLRAAESRFQGLAIAQQQLRSDISKFPSLLTQYGRLLPEIELNRETLKQLLKAQQDIGLEIARGGFDWQIVEEPLLGSKTGPSLPKNLMLGAVVGLFLGGVSAFAKEAADDAVHSSDELKKQVPVPLLGMLPELVSVAATDDDRPLISLPFAKARMLAPEITQVTGWKPFRESLDLLYQNLQLINSVNALKSLVVTSALSGEGKSTLIMGLAMSAARLHQRVLLVDADLRHPTLHKLLNLPNDRGLSSLLTSNAPIPNHIDIQDSNVRSNISVLTAGPAPSDPAKLLSSQRMRDIMATFEQSYDLVLLDAPPVLGMVDAILVASCCDAALLVGRMGRVTRAELTQATNMLNQLNVIGIVANGVSYQTRSDEHDHSTL